ncbi:MAG: hypothetical protein OK456_11080 [Thaumarchaeota archaeon]|nr:hypothetical protein [Nitrososphaerota archaeon]
MNLRSALLGLFVALTIVLASTTVYESGIRTALTSTSTSTSTLTSTLTQTTTVTSTTRLTTTSLLSSVLLGNTALVLNSSDGLGLSIQAEEGPDGNYTFTVRESNLLNSVNNVTEADGWAYRQDSAGPCGPDPYVNPVEFAVVQGNYGQNNYTSSSALPFFNPTILNLCGEVTITGGSNAFGFQPVSDAFSFPIGSAQPEVGQASVTITTTGYWTVVPADAGVMKPFPPGAYTLIGADEWGDVVLLQAFLE